MDRIPSRESASLKWSINGTRYTPWLMFDGEKGYLEIKGSSSPENAINFYDKLFQQLDQLRQTPPAKFEANMALEYFNTSSAKCLFDIFRKLSQIKKSGANVVVNWYYEEDDDDMLESGEDYRDLIDVPFNLVPIEE